jgi:hypothetical protein
LVIVVGGEQKGEMLRYNGKREKLGRGNPAVANRLLQNLVDQVSNEAKSKLLVSDNLQAYLSLKSNICQFQASFNRLQPSSNPPDIPNLIEDLAPKRVNITNTLCCLRRLKLSLTY